MYTLPDSLPTLPRPPLSTLPAYPLPILPHPPTYSTGRSQFQLGSLSYYINAQANGYIPLPDFPEEPPDSSVRDVDVRRAVDRTSVSLKGVTWDRRVVYCMLGGCRTSQLGRKVTREKGPATEPEPVTHALTWSFSYASHGTGHTPLSPIAPWSFFSFRLSPELSCPAAYKLTVLPTHKRFLLMLSTVGPW